MPRTPSRRTTPPVATPAAVIQPGTVRSEVKGGVASVSFGHPKSNSLPGVLLTQLAQELTALGARPDVRVIVLRSEGDGPFCAGASFDELASIRDARAGKEFFSGFAHVVLAIIRAPKFVLVRVHGKVVGGGVGLVAASDFAFATQNASAKLSELAIGIGPFVVGPCIERKIGLAAFSAMSVDADWRDSAWCERHALFSRVFADAAQMDASLDALARVLSKSNPDAMARLKQVFWAGTEQWSSLLYERAEMSGHLVLSDFTRRAIEIFRKGART